MRSRVLVASALLSLSIALSGCQVPAGIPGQGPASSTDVSCTLTALSPVATAEPGAAMPDVHKTPGAVCSNRTSDVVCTSGTRQWRNTTVDMKRQIYTEYGLSYPQPPGSYEADHLVPLELGGADDVSNLWPQPAAPAPGFHQKDQLENRLHELVCGHQLALADAQAAVAADWYAAYRRYVLGG